MGFHKKTGQLDIIGAPSDLGANIRGSLMGPAAIRTAGLFDQLKSSKINATDLGDITVPIRNFSDSEHFLDDIIKICGNLKHSFSRSYSNNNTPVLLGGDHSLSIGTLAAFTNSFQNKNIGLIWIDTHADINTPNTTPSGNIHGMPISTLLGSGHSELVSLFDKCTIPAENIVLIGLRDIDEFEKDLIRDSGVRYYTMRDIDELGIQKVIIEVQNTLIKNVDGIHVSFDLDVMDPTQVPGVSTPVHGGLTLREAHLALEMLYESGKVVSADFVELNPFNDTRGISAYMAVDLICSLFGKRII